MKSIPPSTVAAIYIYLLTGTIKGWNSEQIIKYLTGYIQPFRDNRWNNE